MHRPATYPLPSQTYGDRTSRHRTNADRQRTELHLVQPSASPDGLRIYPSGEAAFGGILHHIATAQRSVELRAFVWRDDLIGNAMARALLAAAHRGVRIFIRKDRIGANYECLSGTQQSLFHKGIGFRQRVRNRFLRTVYAPGPSHKQRPNALARTLLAHPNVDVELGTLFDHSKLFIFDEQRLILGSMGIGDNHHHDWVDVMVEANGTAFVKRLRDRLRGKASFDPARSHDFLLHSRRQHPPGTCPMLAQRLALLDRARYRLSIEMAYLGDRRFTKALLRALRRGVQVTLITSARADVLGDLNLATCRTLLRRSGAAANLRVVLHPRIVHSKVVVVDGHLSDVGSANFTRLSHGVFDEVDLYANETSFAEQLEHLLEQHCREGHVAGPTLGYRRRYVPVERAFVSYMSRGAPR